MAAGTKIQVALCTTELGIGGAERMLVELATRMDRNRFEPVVYSMKPFPESDESSLLPVLNQARIPTVSLEIRGLFSLWTGISKLKKHFRQQKPDICQSFLFHANLISRIAARGAGVEHVFSGIRVAEREKKWHLFLDRQTSRMVEKYVCVSRMVAEFTEKQGKISPSKLEIIPNGINVSDFYGKPKADLSVFGCRAETKKIIAIGRLHHQKGLDWLLTTAPLWLDETRELLIVGTGPEEEKLKAIVEKLSCAKRIHFIGWQKNIPGLLAASDLLVLPSRWEGMPNVVLQAMAAGLPVVATCVEGVVELLDDEVLVPQVCRFGYDGDFSRQINAILNDSGLLGERNHKRVEHHFAMETMVNAYEQLWLKSLSKTDSNDNGEDDEEDVPEYLL